MGAAGGRKKIDQKTEIFQRLCPTTSFPGSSPACPLERESLSRSRGPEGQDPGNEVVHPRLENCK